jgi:hypothetical protein
VVAGDPPSLQPYLGLNFVGGGTFGGDALTATDVAGVVPQAHWNNLTGFTFDPALTPLTLVDADGADTAVTLTATAAEVWYTGTRVVADADGALMQGFVNATTSLEPVLFTLNNVPAGPYNLLVYGAGFDFNANYYQAYSVTGAADYPTYHGRAERGLDYIANPGYRRMVNQTPGSADNGNYVQFDNVNPAPDGSLTISVTWEPPDPALSNGHSPAINAIQLVRVLPVMARPTLSVSWQGQVLTLSWPASAAGFVLESSAALGAGGTWSSVPGVPNPIAGAGSTTVNATGSGAYFRLRK